MLAICLLRFASAGFVVALLSAPTVGAAQTNPTLADGIQQLTSGDTFRAMLTLNEVVAQNSGSAGDRRIVARAHALRAMAFLAQNQPERAQAAVTLALEADPSFEPSSTEVNAATVLLFSRSRGPRAAHPESDGDTAEKAGNFQEAFLAYLHAYQALPAPPPRADDQRLRERIIRVVQRLPTAPVVPPEAQEHARKARQLVEAEAILGNTAGASSTAAAAELTRALRIAPWWPEATFQLATVLQSLQRVDEALMNLNLYKLADPQGLIAAARTNAPAAGATPAAAAPTAAAPARVAAPSTAAPAAAPAAFGTVHIYRRYNYVGSSGRANVDCDGLRMAELQNRRVVTFKVPVGSHAIKVHDDTFTLDVSAGQEYYFKSTVGFRFSTRPVPADEGRAEIKEHNLKPNEPKRTTSTQCTIPTALQPKR